MDRLELLLRRAVALGWLLSAVMALLGAWQGQRAAGRSVGQPLSELPRWYLLALLPYLGVMGRLWRPLPVRLTPSDRLATDMLGGVLALAGMVLIGWGRSALGHMYNVSSTRGVQLYADQELVTDGPFALVRHPMYVGAVLAGLGSVLLYRTWTAILVLAHITVFWVRASREEEALEAEFGQAWRTYADRVPAGLPGLDIVRALTRGQWSRHREAS
jgi:protein-S-isoprenylcysteine O-methyltransferase Ste14